MVKDSMDKNFRESKGEWEKPARWTQDARENLRHGQQIGSGDTTISHKYYGIFSFVY